jgi:lysosomal Pro-X carboxypeptidase
VVFAEHRYYGTSLPFGNKSFDLPYIHYLTSEQALADFAYIITDLKSTPKFSLSPVIGKRIEIFF